MEKNRGKESRKGAQETTQSRKAVLSEKELERLLDLIEKELDTPVIKSFSASIVVDAGEEGTMYKIEIEGEGSESYKESIDRQVSIAIKEARREIEQIERSREEENRDKGTEREV